VCLCLAFKALGSWRRCRRALLQERSCGRSFLIPCGSVPTNDQLKHATGVNSLLSSFGTKRCRLTFQVFCCACCRAISRRRRAKKWVYIAAGAAKRCTKVLDYW
jgi:hypothetical protein